MRGLNLAAMAAAMSAGVGALFSSFASTGFRGPTPARHRRRKNMSFADAVCNAAAVKRAGIRALALKHPLRDEHGAYTQVGRDPLRRIDVDGREVRRIWLAGISAQRGY